MPTAPNATTDLSGGPGITKTDFVREVFRRLDDNPWTDVVANVGGITSSGTSIQVASSTPYQVGMWIDFLEDGTFEVCLITAIPDTTHITVRRGHRGSTAATHAQSAVFRLMPRFLSNVVSEITDDIVLSLWPELYDVREVNWTISSSATPELWYGVTADVERVVSVYQQDNSTPSDLFELNRWSAAPVFLPSAYISATKRGIRVQGVRTSSGDGLLHALYLARLSLSTLTAEQTAILAYLVGATALETALAGETKPDRRAALQAIPTPDVSRTAFMQRAHELMKREKERLMEFLPRRNRRKYFGGRHFSDSGNRTYHTVRGE